MNSTNRPAATATRHVLPFEALQPADFERFCLWLISREGFDQVEHLGSSGHDHGCDILGMRQAEMWAFQCKRVLHFGPRDVNKELDKIFALTERARPAAIVFIATCAISAQTRQVARNRCRDKIICHFWGKTELDEKVGRHKELLRTFFLLSEREYASPEQDCAREPHNLREREQIEALLARIDQLIESRMANPVLSVKDAPLRARLLICDIYGNPIMYEHIYNNCVTVGRSSGNTIRIPDPLISATHLCIEIRGSFLYVVDSGSTNGTYVNGKRITKKVVIHFGDEILLGNHTLLLCPPSEAIRCLTPKTSPRDVAQ